MKTCSQCGESYPETPEYFKPNKRYPCWHSTKCRKCLSADSTTWDKRNPEKRRAIWRSYQHRKKARKAAEIAARFKAR